MFLLKTCSPWLHDDTLRMIIVDLDGYGPGISFTLSRTFPGSQWASPKSSYPKVLKDQKTTFPAMWNWACASCLDWKTVAHKLVLNFSHGCCTSMIQDDWCTCFSGLIFSFQIKSTLWSSGVNPTLENRWETETSSGITWYNMVQPSNIKHLLSRLQLPALLLISCTFWALVLSFSASKRWKDKTFGSTSRSWTGA